MTLQTPPRPSSPIPQSARGKIDQIDWLNVLPFLRIFGAVPAGFRPSRVALAFVLLLSVVAAGRVWDGFAPATASPDGLFAGPIREKQLVDAHNSVRAVLMPELLPEQREKAHTASLDDLEILLANALELKSQDASVAARYSSLMRMIDAARPRSSFEALSEAVRTSFYALIGSVGRADIASAIGAAQTLCAGVVIESWATAPAFTIYFALVCIVVFGWGGGVLARMSAGDLSHRAWTIEQANQFIRPRISSLICAPMFACALVIVLWIPAFLIGLLVNVPALDVVAGGLFGIALATSALSVIVAVVLAVGMPLLAPAVACDGCDAVEAVQRAGAYLFARPLHVLCYAFLSLVTIALAAIAADFLATGAWSFAVHAYVSASGDPAMNAVAALRFLEPYQQAPLPMLDATQSATASFIDMWRTVLCLLIGAAIVSVAFSCATRAYLLARSASDGQDVCDLWEDGITIEIPPASTTP